MKKFFLSAAIASMLLASCQNEQVIESIQGEGQMVTLKVSQNAGSRTALDGLQTVWSEGDQIFVTSADGSTTGVLTLVGQGGDPEGEFKGYVFGNGELSYSVFPVPTNKGLNMSSADANKLNAPMVGNIDGDEVAFTNSVGLVKLNILGLNEGDKINIEGTGIGSNLAYDLATNKWVVKTTGNIISISNARDAEDFFVPVFTNNATATSLTLNVSVNSGTAEEVTIPVAIGKVNPSAPILAVTSTGATVDPSDPNNAAALGTDYVYVTTINELTTAVRGAEGPSYIVVKGGTYDVTSSDEMAIERNVTIVGESGVVLNAVTQKTDWRIFNIYGGSKSLGEEMTVTIKNIELGDETWTKRGLWIRNDLNGSNKNTNNGCKLTVNLENFTCKKAIIDSGEAVYNEDGQMGDKIKVVMKNCDISDFNVQAWKDAKKDTYAELVYDESCNLGVLIDNGYALENILINGKTPTEYGKQTTYVVK